MSKSATHTVHVLLYHSISESTYPHAMPPARFGRQMKHVSKNFDTLSLSEFIAYMRGELQLNRDAVLLTFDDGYEDNLTNALPVLKKYNIPAVLFLVTNSVGKREVNRRGYEFQFLHWDQCRGLLKSGLFSIQSHSHTHPVLSNLAEDAIREEFQISNENIQSKLGYAPTVCAYPKEAYDERVKKIASGAYQYAFGSRGCIGDPSTTDRMALPRILMWQNTPMWKFKLMLHPWYWKLKAIRDRIL